MEKCVRRLSMKCERTFDRDLVKASLTDPGTIRLAAEDGVTDYEPFWHDSLIYLTPFDDAPMGVFMIVPMTSRCCEVHTSILPAYRGRAVEAAREAIKWIFANTPFEKIVSRVPAFNRLALRLSLKAGMRIEGINTRSFLKDGKLHDQYLVGVEKESCQ